jgi:hypothetical protein
VAEQSIREFLQSYDDKPKASVFVRAWGNRKMLIRTLEADERTMFDRETARRNKKDKTRVRVRERLVILCAEDEHGAPAFKPEDEELLASKSNAAIDQLFRVACKHNGFVEDDDEDDGGNS